MTRTALCHCGQLRLLCIGEPIRVSVCHCLDCQRRSGSAFAIQARFAQAMIEVIGEYRTFVRQADSGNSVFNRFCPTCGSTVFYQLGDEPDVIAVAAGAFTDPDYPAPGHSVYESRKKPWVELLGADMEHRSS